MINFLVATVKSVEMIGQRDMTTVLHLLQVIELNMLSSTVLLRYTLTKTCV